jgi:hypothetical protein
MSHHSSMELDGAIFEDSSFSLRLGEATAAAANAPLALLRTVKLSSWPRDMCVTEQDMELS